MKKWIKIIAVSLFGALLLSGCGSDAKDDTEIFKTAFDTFCTNVSLLDASINGIDATSSNARGELLVYLNKVEEEFQSLAALDFPAEFDYLEPLADEAGSYMSEAVSYYHTAFSDEGFQENAAEYARENYSRALKRVQLIISFLHGDVTVDSDLSIQNE